MGQTCALRLPIMISQLRNEEFFADSFINHAMLGIDPARPIALQCMSQRLGLSDSSARIAYRLFDQEIYARNLLRVSLLPMEVIVPRLRREGEVHSLSLILQRIPFPASSVATDASKRRALAGERKR